MGLTVSRYISIVQPLRLLRILCQTFNRSGLVLSSKTRLGWVSLNQDWQKWTWLLCPNVPFSWEDQSLSKDNNLLRRIGCLAVECCVSGSQIIRRKLAPKYACPCDFFIIVPVTIYGTYLCYIHSSTLYPSTIYQTVVGNWSFFYWWKIKRRSCNEWINGFSVHYKVK